MYGHVDLPPGDEDSLKDAVATQGPVSVAIDASFGSFVAYSGQYCSWTHANNC